MLSVAICLYLTYFTTFAFQLWIILIFSFLKKWRVFSKKKKTYSLCKWKEIRNMYVFVQINLQMSLILKEVLNNAQELVTGNSSRWHKSTDFSFHTVSEIPRAAQSVTHSKLQGILTVSDGFLNAYYIFMESDHWYKLSFSKVKKNWKNICALRVPPSQERMRELYIISL